MRISPLASLVLPLLCALAASGLAAEKIVVVGLFTGKAIVEIDGKRRVLAAGETSPEGVKLLSATSEEAVLEIEGEARSYPLGTHIGTTYSTPAEGATVHIWPDASGMYTVTGSINGFPVEFLVDTGATRIAMNRNEARRLGIDYLVEGAPGMSATASGVVPTYYVRLDRVRVGDITLRDVEAAVIDGDFPIDVLLGNSFLNRLEMKREGKMLELTSP